MGAENCKSFCPHAQQEIKLESITLNLPTFRPRADAQNSNPPTGRKFSAQNSKYRSQENQEESTSPPSKQPLLICLDVSNDKENIFKNDAITKDINKHSPVYEAYEDLNAKLFSINLVGQQGLSQLKQKYAQTVLASHRSAQSLTATDEPRPDHQNISNISFSEAKRRISDFSGSFSLIKSQIPDIDKGEQEDWHEMVSGSFFKGHLKPSGEPKSIGAYVLADGRVYYGQAVLNKPHGIGVLIQEDTCFKGKFRHGFAEGEGSYEKQDGTLVINGMWKQGLMVRGTITTDTFSYQGYLRHGVFEGMGVLQTLCPKTRYEGQFYDGKFQGEGKYTTEKYEYVCTFKGGKKQGKGKYRRLQEQNQQPAKYEYGTWQNDKLVRPL